MTSRLKLILLFLLLPIVLMAQIYIPGSHNDWDLDSANVAYLKPDFGGGTNYYGITLQPSLDGEFKIVDTSWDYSWGAGFWITAYDQRWAIGSAGDNALWKGSPGAYVHLCLSNPETKHGENLSVGIMSLSANPVTINSVSQVGSLSGSVYEAFIGSQSVGISLSGAKSAEEKIYLRYTTDNWSSNG
ncbi:MAG: hypothetical protein GY869_05815, partial [Planctomycetes bacterium]|nr:hypothetical protein [Planctomycetota bacterium]